MSVVVVVDVDVDGSLLLIEVLCMRGSLNAGAKNIILHSTRLYCHLGTVRVVYEWLRIVPQ